MREFVKAIAIEQLKRFPSLVHGTSAKYYETPDGERGVLRLGLNGGADSSRRHLAWFLRSLGIEAGEALVAKQVHGDRVYVLDDDSVSGDELAAVEADAIVTRLAGKPIGVLTADCVPIVVYDARLHVAGVVHAGRRGTADKILFKTVGAMRETYGSRPRDIRIGMGPGIGGCCYEVDEACVAPFKEKYRGWASFAGRSSEDRYKLDLFAANVEDGLDAGIPPENIFRSGECTVCMSDRFFSYRREGKTGRMLTVAMLRRLEKV